MTTGAGPRLATFRTVTDRVPDALSPGDDRVAVGAAVVAAIGTVVLGAINIGRSFGYDEAITYHFFVNEGSIRRALSTQLVFNNHPTFSATQAIGWRLGLVGESAQRLGPVLCAAATVGLIVWYTARRSGVAGGLAAGVVLALNPVYLEQARQLRGYSLATLAVVVAGMTLQRSWYDDRHRWLWIQGVAMTVAVTTHAYAALAFLMFAAATVGMGRLRRAHVVTWVGAALAAFALHLPLLDETRANLGSRGSLFRSDFPLLLSRAFVGHEWPAVLVVGGFATAGLIAVAARSRRHLLAIALSGGVLVAAVVVLWAVVQPRDLYFRFFVYVIPLVACLAGRGVALLPRHVDSFGAVAITLVLAGGVGEIVDHRPTIRDGAEIVDRARAGGYEVCGRSAEPMLVYTAPFPLITGIDDFGDCEVFVSVLSVNAAQRAAADARFDGYRDLGGTVRVWADADVIDTVAPEPVATSAGSAPRP